MIKNLDFLNCKGIWIGYNIFKEFSDLRENEPALVEFL